MAKDIEAILHLLLYKTKTQQIKVQDRKDQVVRASKTLGGLKVRAFLLPIFFEAFISIRFCIKTKT